MMKDFFIISMSKTFYFKLLKLLHVVYFESIYLSFISN